MCNTVVDLVIFEQNLAVLPVTVKYVQYVGERVFIMVSDEKGVLLLTTLCRQENIESRVTYYRVFQEFRIGFGGSRPALRSNLVRSGH
jgi:hypothetical protein